MSHQNNSGEALLTVDDLKVHYPIRTGLIPKVTGSVKAVDGVSFELSRGETLAIVGESGCGKSTTGRAVLQLIKPTSGDIRFQGEELTLLNRSTMRSRRRDMQMIFQDPYSSLNPRLTVERILLEPLQAHREGSPPEQQARIREVMSLCGLSPHMLRRYAHEFSGGQRQRICIARSLMLSPRLIVADEPVSALDVSIQSQILNLMQDLQEQLGVAFLFISHDLAVVRHLSHRVGVMYLGRMVEIAPVEKLYENPLHPYTKSLLSSIPKSNSRMAKERMILSGEVPSPANPPAGCAFSTRCPLVTEECRRVRPELSDAGDGRLVSCHLYNK
jgi:peptide/nickel transport system ATP-binding protein/oligopeptide transport system ATP-binding protein